MANNYYDATGILVLDKVTPIITALFGGFKLDARSPCNGQAYIALIAEDNHVAWEDICDELAVLARSLGLQIPDDPPPDMGQVLELLSAHFDAERDEALGNLIERHLFEDDADLEALFLIATRFDDGHGLKAIEFEGCWHCSKPRLFEFGGEGHFISREFDHYNTSSQAIRLGQDMRQALLIDDLDSVAAMVVRETQRLLDGMNDDSQRQQVQQRLLNLLREHGLEPDFDQQFSVCIDAMCQDGALGKTFVFDRFHGSLRMREVEASDLLDADIQSYEMVLFDGGNTHGSRWKHLFFPPQRVHHFIYEND